MLSNARQWLLCALIVATATWPTALWAFAGSLDLTFTGDGSVTTDIGSSYVAAQDVVIQPDGKIIVVGYMTSGGTNDFVLVRYQSDGTLDGSFGNGGIVTTAVGSAMDRSSALALQPDGKIVVAGASNTGIHLDFAVARYDTHGNLDPSFGSGGTVTTAIGSYGSGASSVAVQPDGMIVAAGSSRTLSSNDLAIVRYDADGNLDPSFGGDGTVTTAFAGYYYGSTRLALQVDGRIVVAGAAQNGSYFDFALTRYNADGSLDPTFGGDGTLTTAIGADDDLAEDVAIQADGKIVAAGWARDVEGFVLVRYLPNGDLDPSWGDQGIVTTLVADGASAHGVAIQPDGKIVAVGSAWFDGGQGGFAAVRYESDGVPDATFGYAGTGAVTTSIGSFSASAAAVTIQPDGKIVAAGSWSPNGLDHQIAVVRYVGSVCGNGVIEGGEQCEDGNTVGGDGCSSACLLEGCGLAPANWCHPPTPASKGSVILKDDAADDRLGWKWQKGSATSVQEFGDPTASADYLICIYAAGPTLLAKAFVPAAGTCDGKPCWRASSHGFKYKSRSATPDGITSVLLKSGTDGHAQIAVKGRGGGLAIPAPPFAVPLTVQIERLDGSQCWEATYSAPSVNGNGQFKAKAD